MKATTIARLQFNRRYPLVLLVLFMLWSVAWGIWPVDRADWLLENALAALAVGLLVVSYRWFPLSSVSYTLIVVFLCLHTIGAHYTYSLVPYDRWTRDALGVSLNEAMGFQRNHFDRVVHFLFGLLMAYPIRELFLRIANVRGFWGYYLPLDLTMSFSMLYELIEWAAAIILGGELGQAYLGTQGDIWDAHKDMALATLGAVISMSIVAMINWKLDANFGDEMRESLSVKAKSPLGEVRLREMMKK